MVPKGRASVLPPVGVFVSTPPPSPHGRSTKGTVTLRHGGFLASVGSLVSLWPGQQVFLAGPPTSGLENLQLFLGFVILGCRRDLVAAFPGVLFFVFPFLTLLLCYYRRS